MFWCSEVLSVRWKLYFRVHGRVPCQVGSAKSSGFKGDIGDVEIHAGYANQLVPGSGHSNLTIPSIDPGPESSTKALSPKYSQPLVELGCESSVVCVGIRLEATNLNNRGRVWVQGFRMNTIKSEH